MEKISYGICCFDVIKKCLLLLEKLPCRILKSTPLQKIRIWEKEIKKLERTISSYFDYDERLKNGRYFGKDYFQELLERVRSIYKRKKNLS